MGSSQSHSSGNRRKAHQSKQKPSKSDPRSNGPIRDEQRQNGRTKPTEKNKSDKNLNQPIKTENLENQPTREKVKESKESLSIVDKGRRTDDRRGKKHRKNGDKGNEHSSDNLDKSNGDLPKEHSTDKDKKQGSPKRLSHRKQKERIEKEKKQQRVTKEQLRSLSSTLQRTSWYLGRRLGMDNTQAKRYDTSFATEEERKYQMLLWWRRVQGSKATAQYLIILLEHYKEEEYAALLTSSNGGVAIYDKAPEIAQEEVPSPNHKREPYHSDVANKKGNSFGNMAYEDAVKAQVFEKNHEESHQSERRERKHDRRKDQQKHRSRYGSKEFNDSTLPPWFKKTGDTLERRRHGTTDRKTEDSLDRKTQRRTRNKGDRGTPDTLDRGTPDTLDRSTPDTLDRSTPGTLDRRTPGTLDRQTPISQDGNARRTLERKKKRRSKEVVYAEILNQAMPDGESSRPQDGSQSNTSHTDDSGIVASPPMSPKQSEQTSSQTQNNNQQNGSQDKLSVNISKIGDPKRSSKTLIVRRCSDSVVKFRYSSPLNDTPLAAKPIEPTIREQETEHEVTHDTLRQAYAHNDITNVDDDVTWTNDGTIKRRHKDGSTDDVRKRKNRSSRNRQSRDSKTYDDVDSDVTNSNADITKLGYEKDIRETIQKYESLTKLHEAQNRESMAISIQRHWEATNNTLPRDFSRQPHYASRTSLSSTGSRSTGLSKTSGTNRRSSKNPQRYHFFSFGGKGKFPSRFKGLISGLAILRNGDVVTSDGDNKRIQIFDKRGKFKTTFDTNTELKPKGIGITPDGNIAVCCGDSVNIYDKEGHLHQTFGKGVFQNNSYSICCDTKGNYYVTDISAHTVSVHDINGKIRKRFGFLGTSMIHFNQPVAVAISKNNRLFISDSQNHCIKVYSLSGRPLFRIGAKGSSDGSLWNPLGTCFDENDHLLVADCGNNRISEFDAEGNFVRQVLTEEDGIWMPSLVKVNHLGQLVVCEWERQLIKVFTIETAV